MTRGHRGSLLLRCRALASPPPCRFIPALFKRCPTLSARCHNHNVLPVQGHSPCPFVQAVNDPRSNPAREGFRTHRRRLHIRSARRFRHCSMPAPCDPRGLCMSGCGHPVSAGCAGSRTVRSGTGSPDGTRRRGRGSSRTGGRAWPLPATLSCTSPMAAGSGRCAVTSHLAPSPAEAR